MNYIIRIYISLVISVFLANFIFSNPIFEKYFILHKNFDFNILQLYLSSIFHISFIHLVFNIVGIYILENFIEKEDFYSFTIKWIFFAIGSALFSLFLEPNPILGASGVIMAFISYFYMSFRKTKNMEPIFFLIIANLVIGFLPGISFWGHFGGVFIGILFYFLENFLLRFEIKIFFYSNIILAGISSIFLTFIFTKFIMASLKNNLFF